VLVHHAEPGRHGRLRPRGRKRGTIDLDDARIRLDQAEEHPHQRALPRPVLAEQRMALAGNQGEIDAPQRVDRTEALRDAAHANDLGRAHGVRAP